MGWLFYVLGVLFVWGGEHFCSVVCGFFSKASVMRYSFFFWFLFSEMFFVVSEGLRGLGSPVSSFFWYSYLSHRL